MPKDKSKSQDTIETQTYETDDTIPMEEPKPEEKKSKSKPKLEKEVEIKKSKKDIENEKLKIKEQKESEVFNALRNVKYKSLVSDCYTEMDSYVDMVIKNISYGALIEGSGGTGKSHRTLNKSINTLGNEGIFYLDSFTTPQQFYIDLFNHSDKLIIVDDCMGIMDNPKCLAMLKGALWGVNGKRLVQYRTTKPLKDEYGEFVENTFEMTGGIIIITNYLNKKSPHVQAVLTRINYCVVDIPLKELISILTEIAKLDYEDLSKEERKEVLDYLIEKATDSVENLNIRTLFKMFMFKRYTKNNNNVDKSYWKVLSDKMLKKDDKYALIEKLIDDPQFMNEREREQAYIEMTNKSRATYYNLKKEIEARREKIKKSLGGQ